METMHFHIAKFGSFYRAFVRNKGDPVNKLAPMRNCHRVLDMSN